MPYSGSSVTVTANNSKGTELFVGTASGVDADSYLDGVAQEQISDVSFPNSATHRFTPGDAKPDADIADRDWWISTDTGKTVAKTFDLDAEPQVLIIAPANSDDSLDGTTVSLQMRGKGVFALSLLGIAGTIMLAGFSVFLFMRWWASRIRPPKKDVGLPSGSGPGGGSGPDSSDSGPGGGTGSGRDGGGPAADRTAKGEPGPATQPISTVQPDTGGQAPPRRRDLRNRRSFRAVTASVLGTGLVLSGCANMPIAKPSSPDTTPYERTAVRPGEAGKFMTNYTESLDKTLGDKGSDLDKIQAAPLIDHTRAQIQIADKAKQKLRAPNFTEVVAGSPNFTEYPMWFYAFGTADKKSTDGDKQLTQVMLVTRESASTDPLVRSASYIPTEQMPALMADDRGAVETGSEDFSEDLTTASGDVSSFLVDGKAKSGGPEGLKEGGFKGFRDYLGDLRDKDSGFDKVDVDCKPYEDLKFEDMTLSTENGAIGMGEVRCTLTIKAPSDYALDLGDTVEAVKTNDKEGDTIKVDTAHPYVLMKTGDELTAVATDWNVLSSKVE
ncbi:hypothetical protein BI49514_00775 [Brevibacterium iodinum ATCC 49514]|uniref:Uncharacterized protein n=1 Tax=Brevibacterium iodinum ATCC 49514 TaxID=1255616 RepID=A0A2H1IC41_9MICO|nr:hypothetical protein [Brevibacterium iodinum]SMX72676.1 hypothetical protein BI49514_00775 [Brevibacterium iodinum ATCC 49514]SUW13156.1 Uncharacterised protein [Brevibacterium iodinum]